MGRSVPMTSMDLSAHHAHPQTQSRASPTSTTTPETGSRIERADDHHVDIQTQVVETIPVSVPAESGRHIESESREGALVVRVAENESETTSQRSNNISQNLQQQQQQRVSPPFLPDLIQDIAQPSVQNEANIQSVPAMGHSVNAHQRTFDAASFSCTQRQSQDAGSLSCTHNQSSVMVVPMVITLGCPNCGPSPQVDTRTNCNSCHASVRNQMHPIQSVQSLQPVHTHIPSGQGSVIQLNVPISVPCSTPSSIGLNQAQPHQCVSTQNTKDTVSQRRSAQKSKRVSKSARKSTLSQDQITEIHATCLTLMKQSGFYHGVLSMEAARKLLKRTTVGTFLLRDSSSPTYPFSLSVKTDRGTTSIRISFEAGVYRLDCEAAALRRMKSFDCVLKLVDYYVECAKSDSAGSCVFLERSGRKDTPVLLRKPYLTQPRSLKHAARVAFNAAYSEEQKLRYFQFGKPDIETFLKAYPYKV